MVGKVLIPQQDVLFRNAHHQITITVYCFYTKSFTKQKQSSCFSDSCCVLWVFFLWSWIMGAYLPLVGKGLTVKLCSVLLSLWGSRKEFWKLPEARHMFFTLVNLEHWGQSEHWSSLLTNLSAPVFLGKKGYIWSWYRYHNCLFTSLLLQFMVLLFTFATNNRRLLQKVLLGVNGFILSFLPNTRYLVANSISY